MEGIKLPELSDYECELFGFGREGIILRPTKNNIPNFFWRTMQYLILGNKWVKYKDNKSK